MNIVITGSNRGIGLELARQYIIGGHTVIATARKPDNAIALDKLKGQYPQQCFILKLDVTRQDDCDSLESFLEDYAVDVLVNNAGAKITPVENPDLKAMTLSFDINTLGPLRVINAVLPALLRGNKSKIINISTMMASIRNAGSDNMPYRVSKAALNMASRMQAVELRNKGICVVSLHPGWVKTDMGGPAAPITIKDSASSIISLINGLSIADSGRFIDVINNGRDISF